MPRIFPQCGNFASPLATSALSCRQQANIGQPLQMRLVRIENRCLTNAELALLLKLVESGRLRPMPEVLPASEIEGEAQVVNGTLKR